MEPIFSTPGTTCVGKTAFSQPRNKQLYLRPGADNNLSLCQRLIYGDVVTVGRRYCLDPQLTTTPRRRQRRRQRYLFSFCRRLRRQINRSNKNPPCPIRLQRIKSLTRPEFRLYRSRLSVADM